MMTPCFRPRPSLRQRWPIRPPRFGAICAALILSGGNAAGVAAAPVDHVAADDAQLARVAYRLAIGAASLCPRKVPVSGLAWRQLGDFEPGDRAQAIAALGLDQGPALVAVGSPEAVAAQLAVGDVIVTANGKPLTDAAADAALTDPAARRRALDAVMLRFEATLAAGPAALSVARDGVRRSVMLSPPSGCPLRARIAQSRQHNAFSNAGFVTVTARFMRDVRSDDELAFVLAHELGHVVLDQAGVGKRERELAADRFAARAVVAAGYDPAGAVALLGRIRWKHFQLPGFGGHPTIGARIEQWRRETAAATSPAAR